MDKNTEVISAFYDKALTVNAETTPAEVLSSVLAPDFVSRGSVNTETKDELIGRFGFFGQLIPDLKTEIQDRLHKAGVEVIEARISHLAYAPEIASAMLKRQQANAIIAARAKIGEGAATKT